MERKFFKEALFKKISLLYVEDEEEVLLTTTKFLKRRFSTVYTAKNGSEGLEIFKNFSPDIVITDIKMPLMDGIKLSEEIKKINPNTPIIIITAHTEVEYLLKAIEIGVDYYLLKPLDLDRLYQVLEKSTQDLIYDRILTAQSKVIETILNLNPCFFILIERNKIKFVNQNLLTFLGYTDLEEFLKDPKDLKDLEIRWEAFIEKCKKEPIPLKLGGEKCFLLKAFYFPELELTLLALICKKEKKLREEKEVLCSNPCYISRILREELWIV